MLRKSEGAVLHRGCQLQIGKKRELVIAAAHKGKQDRARGSGLGSRKGDKHQGQVGDKRRAEEEGSGAENYKSFTHIGTYLSSNNLSYFASVVLYLES